MIIQGNNPQIKSQVQQIHQVQQSTPSISQAVMTSGASQNNPMVSRAVPASVSEVVPPTTIAPTIVAQTTADQLLNEQEQEELLQSEVGIGLGTDSALEADDVGGAGLHVQQEETVLTTEDAGREQ